MATYTEQIVNILQTDAALRILLGVTAAPYGVYYQKPPKVYTKAVVYYSGGSTFDTQAHGVAWERNQLNFQVHSDTITGLKSIEDRIIALLNDKRTNTTAGTDGSIKSIKLDFITQETWDELLKVWWKTLRFEIRIAR